jgi:hypothetical protein
LWPFGTLRGNLVCFPRFGMLYQEKFGNSGLNSCFYSDPEDGVQESSGQEVHRRPHLHPAQGLQGLSQDGLHQGPHQRAQENSQESLLLGKL